MKLIFAVIIVTAAFGARASGISDNALFLGICALLAGWIAHNEKG